MNLKEFLDNWNREFWRCGAIIRRADFAGNFRPTAVEFLLVGVPLELREKRELSIVRIVPRGRVEDWAFRPCHTLLEGTLELELVTEDPKLTRKYLESLDCEGDRTDYPDRVVMLRNGETYVIAEGFDATWVDAEDPNHGIST
jgi:hypothetical protein